MFFVYLNKLIAADFTLTQSATLRFQLFTLTNDGNVKILKLKLKIPNELNALIIMWSE